MVILIVLLVWLWKCSEKCLVMLIGIIFSDCVLLDVYVVNVFGILCVIRMLVFCVCMLICIGMFLWIVIMGCVYGVWLWFMLMEKCCCCGSVGDVCDICFVMLYVSSSVNVIVIYVDVCWCFVLMFVFCFIDIYVMWGGFVKLFVYWVDLILMDGSEWCCDEILIYCGLLRNCVLSNLSRCDEWSVVLMLFWWVVGKGMGVWCDGLLGNCINDIWCVDVWVLFLVIVFVNVCVLLCVVVFWLGFDVLLFLWILLCCVVGSLVMYWLWC